MNVLAYISVFYALLCLAYFLFQEKLIFRSTSPGKGAPYRLSCEHEEKWFNTSDHATLHGLLLKTPGTSSGLIFYLHGNTGNLHRWGIIAQELIELGFDVFVLDYRGYGMSTGRRTESQMHADARLVYQEMLREYGAGKTFIYGRSLGSGFAVRLASREASAGLILETPFLSLLDVGQSYFRFLPMKWLLRFPLHSDRFIKQVRSPILIFHGTRDRVVPYRSAFSLYEKVQHRPDVRMMTIPGAGHNNLNAYPSFWDGLKEFLQHVESSAKGEIKNPEQ